MPPCVQTQKIMKKIALDRTTERCLTHVTSPEKTDCDLGSWGKGLFNLNSTCRNFTLFCWKSCVVSSGFFFKKKSVNASQLRLLLFFRRQYKKKKINAGTTIAVYFWNTHFPRKKKGERSIKTYYSRKLTDVLFPSSAARRFFPSFSSVIIIRSTCGLQQPR